MKINPRRFYNSTLYFGLSFLFITGAFFHYAGNRTQRRNLERKLDSLVSRVSALESRPVQESVSVASPIPSSEPTQSKEYPPPRLLGSGQTGNWMYSDLRLPSGEVRRYYLRKDASPAQMKSLLSNIQFDVDDSIQKLASFKDKKSD